jgi:hypothetical protein
MRCCLRTKHSWRATQRQQTRMMLRQPTSNCHGERLLSWRGREPLLYQCPQQHSLPSSSHVAPANALHCFQTSLARVSANIYYTCLPLHRIQRQVCATLATEKRALAGSCAAVAAWRAALESGRPLSRLYEA